MCLSGLDSVLVSGAYAFIKMGTVLKLFGIVSMCWQDVLVVMMLHENLVAHEY